MSGFHAILRGFEFRGAGYAAGPEQVFGFVLEGVIYECRRQAATVRPAGVALMFRKIGEIPIFTS
ncbi:hypothetical protein COW53_03145 [bacterium CG17_big_fil_post_rev_8_21_14_2_50_64_8]|nr:MAG: hypothetical protein COW53_03145 [bacterium CG17_big_fil_post_rev_8_21_14_2_50_64_8]PJA73210.1 MAG: hypothetical protein CO151_14575 [bacterium CG_4_9_14_3_um_filter_65_15]